MASRFKCSQDTQDKIKAFEEADLKYRLDWEAFEAENATRLEKLDKLRDDRNAKLDEAKRSLRQEVELVEDMRMTATQGPFKIQKKWSDFYIPDKLASMLVDFGLYDSAVVDGIVKLSVETARFSEVRRFLESHGIDKEFECCEDGKEDHTAISGPKQIPPFGAELKKE